MVNAATAATTASRATSRKREGSSPDHAIAAMRQKPMPYMPSKWTGNQPKCGAKT